jgi:hypothetical protein
VHAQGRAPSYIEVKARFCPRGGLASRPAIFFGTVLDAEAETPVVGASISLVYSDSTPTGPVERVRRATTLDDGSFAICGMPVTYKGAVQATKDEKSTAEAPVAASEQLLGGAVLMLNISGTFKSVLKGRVTVKGGMPVRDAQVAVQGAPSVAVTGADGTFTLNDLPSGTQAAVVRKIGFAPATVGVNLSTHQPRDVTVVLSEAQVLATVHVAGKMETALDKVGFISRQRSALGHFIGPDEIEQRHPLMFTDLLQTVAGFRVTSVGVGRLVEASRGTNACVSIFVDRTPFQQMQPGDLDDAFHPSDIGAIELYPSPNDVPAEFHASRGDCATIVMWTKTRLARP